MLSVCHSHPRDRPAREPGLWGLHTQWHPPKRVVPPVLEMGRARTEARAFWAPQSRWERLLRNVMYFLRDRLKWKC